jgi:hypothetical protein
VFYFRARIVHEINMSNFLIRVITVYILGSALIDLFEAFWFRFPRRGNACPRSVLTVVVDRKCVRDLKTMTSKSGSWSRIWKLRPIFSANGVCALI